MRRNCPNCGAPYEVELNKCPYCGTSYFDLTAIDLYNREPFYLKLKAGNMIFTSKVIVKPDATILISQDSVECIGECGNIISKACVSNSVDIDIGFTSVLDISDKELYRIEYGEV